MADLFALAQHNPFWAWAALGAAFLAVETLTGSGWLLWPAASAGVMALLSLAIPLEPAPAAGLFAVLTIVATYAGRRLLPAQAGPAGHDINDPSTRLLGHHGKAVTTFDGRTGRVFIDGKEWAADLDDDIALAAGAAVEVTGISGARLRVRPAH